MAFLDSKVFNVRLEERLHELTWAVWDDRSRELLLVADDSWGHFDYRRRVRGLRRPDIKRAVARLERLFRGLAAVSGRVVHAAIEELPYEMRERHGPAPRDIRPLDAIAGVRR
jgi:hypothetical protein